MATAGFSSWQDKKTRKWTSQVRIPIYGSKALRKQFKGHLTKRAALQRAHDFAEAYSRGMISRGQLTVERAARGYIDSVRGHLREGTTGNYAHLIKLYLLPTFGDRKIDSIKSAELGNWLMELRARGLKASTVNTIRTRARGVFAWAYDNEYITRNPMDSVKPHRSQRGDATDVREAWSLEEAKAALEAFELNGLDLFVSFAVLTGLRKGEILALRWSDIAPDGSVFKVDKTRGEVRCVDSDWNFTSKVMESNTKTVASTRTLGLQRILGEKIAARRSFLESQNISPNREDHLITSRSMNAISLSTLHRTYKRVLSDASIRYIRIHDMRHSAIVLSLVAGGRLEESTQGAGHSGTDITRRQYAKYVPALGDRFTKTLDDFLS